MARRERAGAPASRQAGGPARRPVAGDFQLTPEVEASLNALARAGREDPAARNELYAALGLKVARFLAPYRGRELSGMEFADVEQEAFLVFAGLVADWGGTGSFGRYFLGFFPWRLRHAVEAGERQWPRGRLTVLWDESLPGAPPADEPEDIDVAAQVGALSVDERRLLRLRLVEDRQLEEIAPLFGWSRRTAYRRWRALLDRLGRLLAGNQPPPAHVGPGAKRAS
jgi:DNA-directed RNA polymerase specialized sigma24 family protein